MPGSAQYQSLQAAQSGYGRVPSTAPSPINSPNVSTPSNLLSNSSANFRGGPPPRISFPVSSLAEGSHASTTQMVDNSSGRATSGFNDRTPMTPEETAAHQANYAAASSAAGSTGAAASSTGTGLGAVATGAGIGLGLAAAAATTLSKENSKALAPSTNSSTTPAVSKPTQTVVDKPRLPDVVPTVPSSVTSQQPPGTSSQQPVRFRGTYLYGMRKTKQRKR